MANQDWVSCITGGPHASGAGAALTSATSATISPTQSNTANGSAVAIINAAPFGWSPGLLVRVTARGYITTTTTAGTLTFILGARLNNVASSPTQVTLATTAAATLGGTTLMTGIQWKFAALIRCTAIAPTGNTVSTQGEVILPWTTAVPTIGTGGAGNAIMLPMPSASGETAAAVDTTQLQGIELRATQATSADTIQLTEWVVEALD